MYDMQYLTQTVLCCMTLHAHRTCVVLTEYITSAHTPLVIKTEAQGPDDQIKHIHIHLMFLKCSSIVSVASKNVEQFKGMY